MCILVGNKLDLADPEIMSPKSLKRSFNKAKKAGIDLDKEILKGNDSIKREVSYDEAKTYAK